MIYNTDIARIRFQIEKHTGAVETLSSGQPEFWKGADWRIDLGVFLGNVAVDTTKWATMNLQVKPLNDFAATPLLNATLSSGFANDLTLDTWLDGTKQHCTFTFTGTQTVALNLGGALSKEFSLIVWGASNDATAKQIVIGVVTIKVVEAGIGSGAG